MQGIDAAKKDDFSHLAANGLRGVGPVAHEGDSLFFGKADGIGRGGVDQGTINPHRGSRRVDVEINGEEVQGIERHGVVDGRHPGGVLGQFRVEGGGVCGTKFPFPVSTVSIGKKSVLSTTDPARIHPGDEEASQIAVENVAESALEEIVPIE